MKQMKLILSLLLVMALTAATALTFGSCDKPDVGDPSGTTTNTALDSVSDSQETPKAEKTITVTVTDDKGEDTVFTITTTAEFLRGALEQEKLVQGDESEYGLYVKVVNGIEADYDKNGAYWGFFKGGEYLPSGVDTTPIADGDAFEIVYTKG